MDNRALLFRIDYLQVLVVVLISAIGVVLISSATSTNENFTGLWQKQLVVLFVGLVLMIVTAMINYRILIKLSIPIYLIVLAMLIALFIYGKVAGGARSWITLGGIGFQPSEFAKLAIVLVLAGYFSKLEKRSIGLFDLIMPATYLAVPLVLTALQPDLGTAITMVPLFIGTAIVSGLRFRAIIALILIGLILLSFAWMFLLKDYQKERLRSFLNPGDDPKRSGYQIKQSLIAIGSGGLLGKGLFLGSQSQLNFVPAQHTDFIFSVLGEELGFLFVAIILILYAALFTRALFPLRHVHDVPGILIVSGIVSYISFQTVINILMSIGLFPTTGVPLPFLSYGGSSLMTNMIAIGMIMSVYAHRSDASTI